MGRSPPRPALMVKEFNQALIRQELSDHIAASGRVPMDGKAKFILIAGAA